MRKLTTTQVEKAKERQHETYEKLLLGVKEVFTSGRLAEVLKISARFHNYSFNNCILIWMQFPNATRVKGFHQWQHDFKRKVKKGARGIAIQAPLMRKVQLVDETTDEDYFAERLVGFKNVYVWDVSQTDGEPLPELVDPLNNVSDRTGWLLQRLDEISPMPIKLDKLNGGARGETNYTNNEIILSDEMFGDDLVKTKVHEIVHAALHRPEIGMREHHELIAEAVSYIICDNYGIDSGAYSFGYLASWVNTNDPENAIEKLSLVSEEAIKAARYIISSIDELKPLTPTVVDGGVEA